MDKQRRKELQQQYKERKVVGGVYRIDCAATGKYYLDRTDDMQATHNWFESCRKWGSCTLPHLQEDWKRHGMEAFSLEELDLLEKGEEQTRREFQKDLETLLELWREKLPEETRYN